MTDGVNIMKDFYIFKLSSAWNTLIHRKYIQTNTYLYSK